MHSRPLPSIVALLAMAGSAGAVDVDFAPLFDSSAPRDPATGLGHVGYPFLIGVFETTNSQYAEFLNAVARSDTNGLYDDRMGTLDRGGISRLVFTPPVGPSVVTFSARTNMGDKPVNFVDLNDAKRFCNWLHNGQLTGPQADWTTEDGAYTFTASSSSGGRNPGARFWIPNADEWYKAAYFSPVGTTGAGSPYWRYPTASDSLPAVATADATGSVSNPGDNVANYAFGAVWNGQSGNVTTVGSTLSDSPSGAFDMAGNVAEIVEPPGDSPDALLIMGGEFRENAFLFQSSAPQPTSTAYDGLGFRIAAAPPRPAGCLPWVDVRNPGNTGLDGATGLGHVPYPYRIMETEVTNASFAQFLSAVASATDPFELYNINMGSSPSGGITRSGSPGAFTYTVKEGFRGKPVNFVTFFDALRFANWVHNGASFGGDTETGAYSLFGGSATPSNGDTVTRNGDARFFLPDENEWIKAALFDPVDPGADAGGTPDYWIFATGSDTEPIQAQSDSSGKIRIPGSGFSPVANWGQNVNWNGTDDGNVSCIGSGGPGSRSPSGAADMAGNVWEWTESSVDAVPGTRGLRGGSFSDEGSIAGELLLATAPIVERADRGFRLAALPTEPFRITEIAFAGSDRIEISFTAEVGKFYRIQGSSDLRTWTTLLPFALVDSNGSGVFEREPVPLPSPRPEAMFFRVLQSP